MPRPIVGESRALMQALKQLERVGRTDTTVLVLGETGTGKGWRLAMFMFTVGASTVCSHRSTVGRSRRIAEQRTFWAQEKVRLQGRSRPKGLFESAEGSTVFLDEIGEVSPAVQVRLLRVLQEKEVQPVGTHTPIKVDVRIVAATNRDLKAEVEAGRFQRGPLLSAQCLSGEVAPVARNERMTLKFLLSAFASPHVLDTIYGLADLPMKP